MFYWAGSYHFCFLVLFFICSNINLIRKYCNYKTDIAMTIQLNELFALNGDNIIVFCNNIIYQNK